MCAICGYRETFVTVKSVVRPDVPVRSTSKYGSRSVAAGLILISQLSSLSIDEGGAVLLAALLRSAEATEEVA